MTAIRAALVVLIAVAAIVSTGCGGGEAVGKDSLIKQSEAVGSLAAEGALLATDSAAGRSTRIFRRVHSSELTDAATTVEQSLAAARTEPALQPELRKLRALASRVRVALAELGSASHDEQRELGRRLEEAAGESEQVGEELG